MLLIPSSLYLVFMLIPSFGGLVLGFSNWKGMSLKINFTGFDNFIKAFQDPIFYKSIYNSLFIFVFSTLITFSVAFFFAVVLAKKIIRERNVYRTVYFFPTAVPSIIISIMWMVVFNPNFGILNQFLGLFGIEPQIWLGDTSLVLPSVIVIMVWKLTGFYIILFMAAIQNIPQSIYESAKIDGAGEIRQTFTITLPLLRDVIRTSLIFFLINAENCGFQVIYILTQGGPNRASEIMTTYMYSQITEQSRFGYGSALSFLILAITMILALTMLKLTEHETYQY
jgi:N-acetylglucosamine transport system permease protein